MSEAITIVCVPPRMFGPVWLKCGEVVREAVRTAGNLGDVLARIEDESLQCWLVLRNGYTPAAAWFTDINVQDDGSRWLGVYGLNGKGVREWARALSDRMVDFARAERCERVLFAGRKAWGRLLPECKPLRAEGGATIWERAAT